jgi:hypothetical protein
MKTTRYFEEQVLRKRPYLKVEWIEAALADRSLASSSPMAAFAFGIVSNWRKRENPISCAL